MYIFEGTWRSSDHINETSSAIQKKLLGEGEFLAPATIPTKRMSSEGARLQP